MKALGPNYNVTLTPDHGRTSVYLLCRTAEWQPDVIVIDIGLHDVCRAGPGGVCETDGETYQECVREMLSLLRRYTHARLFWATTIPVAENGPNEPFRNKDIDAYNRLAMGEAREAGVEVIDLNAALRPRMAEFNKETFRLKPEGYRFLGETVASAIARQIASPQ